MVYKQAWSIKNYRYVEDVSGIPAAGGTIRICAAVAGQKFI
jgi:hypothetical protein